MAQYQIDFLRPDEVRDHPDILALWKTLLAASTNPYRMYQSPEWFDHLTSLPHGSRLHLCTIRTLHELLGVIPLERYRYRLPFSGIPARTYPLSLNTIEVLGSIPLLPVTAELYHALIEGVWSFFPKTDAIYFKSFPVESHPYRALCEVEANGPFRIYAEQEARTLYGVTLPPTFEEYAQLFTAKKRYNFNRQIRLLRAVGEGDLRLECIRQHHEVDRFVKTLADIAPRSWKYRRVGFRIDVETLRHDLTDAADRNLLRSYLLSGGGQNYAYVLGYQFNDLYHYAEIGFDEAFRTYSPGNTSLYMILKEFCDEQIIKYVNLGIHDAEYKRQFATTAVKDATLLLLKPTLLNQIRMSVHAAWHALGRSVKRRFLTGQTLPVSTGRVDGDEAPSPKAGLLRRGRSR